MTKPTEALLWRIEKNPLHQYLILALITFFGASLRLYKLGEWSFWSDEIITVIRAQRIIDQGIDFSPVSLTLTSILLDFLGTSEWSARLAPAIIGIISIPMLYFLAKIILEPATALLASLLLALSPWHLYWSQNARFYTALLLFYSMALLTFYLGIEKDRPWLLLISMLFLGLAIMERTLAATFIFVIGTYFVLIKVLGFEVPPGFKARNFALFFLPGILFGFYYIFPYLQQPSRFLRDFGWINNWVNNNPFWILAGVVYYVGIPTICMGAFGGLYLLTKKNRAALLLSLSAFVPLLLIVILSTFLYTANRYLFISLIGWIILAAAFAKELLFHTLESTRMLALGAVVLLLLAPLSEDILYFKYQHGNRDNWKAAFNLVKQRKGDDDIVVSANHQLSDYYLGEKTISMGSVDLAQLQTNGKRIWLIEDMNVVDKWPWVLEWVDDNARMVANFDNYVQARNFKMRVYLYEPGLSQDVSRK